MAEASYPQSIPSFTTKRDQIDINYAAHINRLQSEVRAMATELGTVPRGSHDSVRDRLEDLTANKSSTTHHHDERYWRRTLVTSKGQILVGTGDQNVEALNPGADGRVLKSDASTASGLRWGSLSHADFGDLGGDHYPQYALADGTRGAFLRLAGGTLGGHVVLDSHSEKVIDKGDITGVTTFDGDVGSLFAARMVGEVTVDLQAGAAAGTGYTVAIVFAQDTLGGRGWTWPIGVRWVGSGPPAPAAAGSITLTSFLTLDGGATWIGVALNEYE